MYGDADVGVYPAELWPFIQENRKNLKATVYILADSPRLGVEITLTEEDGDIILAASVNGETVESEIIVGKGDAFVTARDMYEDFLMPCDPDEPEEPEEPEESEPEEEEEAVDDLIQQHEDDVLQDEIDQRSCDMLEALDDFLRVVLDDQYGELDSDMLGILLDSFLSIVANEGFVIYSPCFLDDGKGGEVYDEYPYNSEAEVAAYFATTPGDRVEI